jgi:hypothetical protein
MSNPPDPTTTLKAIFEAQWNTTNCPLPNFFTPATTKRIDADVKDAVQIYSVNRSDTKMGVSNAYRTRVDVCTVDFITFVSYERFEKMRYEIERILDLAGTRSSPTTYPTGTPYTANAYDQIVPINSTTREDRNRNWWRGLIEVEMRAYWEAR